VLFIQGRTLFLLCHCCATAAFSFPKNTKNPNPSPIEKRFGSSISAAVFPVDIPTGWEPQRNLAVRALRVAFADFSAAPWQGFEKSERGPNNSSLFQPLAAVVVVAVRILPAHCKSQPVVRHSYGLGTAG
jgi:hypothetical protein